MAGRSSGFPFLAEELWVIDNFRGRRVIKGGDLGRLSMLCTHANRKL